MNNSVFSPSRHPMLTHCTARMVNIPEFIASSAITHPCSEERYVYCVVDKLKSFSSIIVLSEEENFLVFESNYVSRCARGQGLKIKVPGCGVPQLGTGLQCAHSSLEGVDEQSALCFFFPALPVSGLILRW